MLPKPLLFVAIALVSHCGNSAQSQESSSNRPKQWALLIAAEDYEKAPKLQFTVNDVRRLRETLTKRGGMLESHVLSLTDDGEKLADRPVKASIEALLPAFLKKPGPQDSVIVYFSGHGFRDKDGKLYLAPLDIDPANAAATGVPIEWFRGLLDECPAAFKLLVLDACHAGSEKGEDGPPSASAKDIGDSFKGAKGVVTIASSTAEEKSRIWEWKQQSLFSYWLNEGLNEPFCWQIQCNRPHEDGKIASSGQFHNKGFAIGIVVTQLGKISRERFGHRRRHVTKPHGTCGYLAL